MNTENRLSDLITLVNNIYTYDDYIPSGEALSRVRIQDIVHYLRISHKYYVEDALGSLETSIRSVLAPCDEKRKNVILSFFSTFRDEMERHFQYEEQYVFPYAKALLDGTPSEPAAIGEEDHTNIEEKIGDLKNIVMKYLPAECDPGETIALMKQLFYLEDDLRKHTAIEDRILLPLLRRLERNV